MKKLIAILIGLLALNISTHALATNPYSLQSALCAAVENSNPSARILSRLGNEFFEQKDTRLVTSYPVSLQSVFTKGKDNRIYFVSRWQDLDPKRTYTFLCEWIDPDGKAYRMSTASMRTPERLDPGVFFTYTAYLDLGREMKEGQWQVNLLLNGDLVQIKDLTITSK